MDTSMEKPLLSDKTKMSFSSSRLRALLFVTGCLVAGFSQLILSQILWEQDILTKPMKEVLVFSLLWSFWTCLIVFSAMGIVVRYLTWEYELSREDDFVFSLEAFYIMGSLLAVSTSWFSFDFLDMKFPAHGHTFSLLGLSLFTYGLFFKSMTTRIRQKRAKGVEKSASDDLLPTYQLLAATLGLLVGVCSQFVLSFTFLNQNHLLGSNTTVFTLLWAFLTVASTFTGCVVLRLLVDTEHTQPCEKERIFLRMESHYVFCTLIGICFAWFAMNASYGTNQHLLPSVAMLGVSLLAFRYIVWLFPEDECLKEIELSSDSSDDDEEIHV